MTYMPAAAGCLDPRYNEWGRACWELQHANFQNKGRGVAAQLDWRFLACVSEDDASVVSISETEKWMAGHIMAARPLVSGASIFGSSSIGFYFFISDAGPLRSIGIHLQMQAHQIGPLSLLTNLAPSWRFWRLTTENWRSTACNDSKICFETQLIFMRRCSAIFWAAPEAASNLEVHVGLASERY